MTRVYEVLHYIHEHCNERLSAAETAARFGYSRWYFCEKFKRAAGCSFVDYVRHYRIQLAALDILAGSKVTDVALRCGYESVGGFNKAFLSEYGCLPREYRRRVKESQLYYERRKLTMLTLSDRCAALCEEAQAHTHARKIRYQWIVYRTLAVTEAHDQGLSNPERMAAGIAAVIEQHRPFIAPGELIVGNNFDEEQFDWSRLPDTPAIREDMAACGFTQAEIDAFFAAQPQLDAVMERGPETVLTRQEQDSEAEWASVGRCIDANHTVLGYEKVLRLGFDGLLSEVEAARKAHGDAPLYRATERLCRAAATLGERYAAAAQTLLDSGDPAYSEADLSRIVAVCRRVPRHPAEHFDEAVQALWMAHMVNTWEDGINANSLGRLDQILYPYYKKDIDEGVLTPQEAFDILGCLWVKLYRDYDVQQSCVGGTDAAGNSQVNELSYRMLDITEQLGFVRCLSVRFGTDTPREFLRRALEVVGHVQKGVPFFFNDDVMIPALTGAGIPLPDAADYTQIGCVETVIPGKSNPHAVTGEINLLKALEYVLNDGVSMKDPSRDVGLHQGPLARYTTYDKLYEAVMTEVEHLLDMTCSKVKRLRAGSEIHAPRPYKSLLTEGCLAQGRDFNQAGALYDYYQIMLGGVPNLADALCVIRHLVYEEKQYTLPQLKTVLERNFPDEEERLRFVNRFPKYGNDQDEVDTVAAAMIDRCCTCLEELSARYELSFHAQPFTYLWMIEHGRECAASPDGRRAGEVIAYSLSPMQGRDFSGLTALFRSLCKLPTTRTPGTTSAIVEIDPKLFTDANVEKLTDILRAAGREGLSNVQFNTVDAATLRDAQKHPENYPNLAVRVSGFSQKFRLLDPALQDHIIERTKHTCL